MQASDVGAVRCIAGTADSRCAVEVDDVLLAEAELPRGRHAVGDALDDAVGTFEATSCSFTPGLKRSCASIMPSTSKGTRNMASIGWPLRGLLRKRFCRWRTYAVPSPGVGAVSATAAAGAP